MRALPFRNAVIVLVGAIVLLGGCRPDEKDRLIRYEAGQYRGKADQPLSEEARRALRNRHSGQAGIHTNLAQGGGGSAESGGARSIDTTELRRRAGAQAGSSVRQP